MVQQQRLNRVSGQLPVTAYELLGKARRSGALTEGFGYLSAWLAGVEQEERSSLFVTRRPRASRLLHGNALPGELLKHAALGSPGIHLCAGGG